MTQLPANTATATLTPRQAAVVYDVLNSVVDTDVDGEPPVTTVAEITAVIYALIDQGVTGRDYA